MGGAVVVVVVFGGRLGGVWPLNQLMMIPNLSSSHSRLINIDLHMRLQTRLWLRPLILLLIGAGIVVGGISGCGV